MEKLKYLKFILDRSSASRFDKVLLSKWLVDKYGDSNKVLFTYEEFKELVDYLLLNQLQFYVVPFTNKSRKITFSYYDRNNRSSLHPR